jgi:hypothetical protein
VTGFVGEQFALPEALDELRAARHGTPSTEVARVPATDPLNLVGVLSPGPRVPAIVGNAVLGLLLLSQNLRAAEQLHYVYGLLPAGMVIFAYSARRDNHLRNILIFSIAALLAAALSTRALTVSGIMG